MTVAATVLGRAVLVVSLALGVAACTGAPTPAARSTPTPISTSTSTPTSTSSGASSSGRPAPPVTSGSDYLALGDSVSFGFRESQTRPRPDYSDPSDFVGFPELVGRALHLRVANASCPGETSASLLDRTAASFGCERGADGTSTGGYRTHYPLHVRYRGSQLAYSVHYLRTHRDTRLVTLMIGANDAFRCVATTADRCVSEFAGVRARLTRHVAVTIRALRGRARYRGRIVLVTYYASDYQGLAAAESALLNTAMTAGGRGGDVSVANGFGAFEHAVRHSGGDSCRAGLLTQLSTGGCGVHPSAAGQHLLARAVERTIAG